MPCVPKPKSQRRDYYAELGLKHGVWHPELAALIKHYPQSAEAFAAKYEHHSELMKAQQAAGTLAPHMVDLPPGMASYEFTRIRSKAATQAQLIVEKMAIEDPDLTPSALKALAVASEIMLTVDENTKRPLYNGQNRLAAARLICDFVQAKPAQRVDATVVRAEDFLTVLASKSE